MVKKYPILAVGLRYGLVSGGLTVVLFFAVTFFGENPLIVNKWFDYFLIPALVFAAIREFRIYYNARALQFWQGVSVGFVIYVTTALVFAAVIGLYLATHGQSWVTDYVHNRVALVEENQDAFTEELGEETYRRVLTEVQATTTTDLILDDVFRKLMIGVFVTLIIAMVQRRTPTQEMT